MPLYRSHLHSFMCALFGVAITFRSLAWTTRLVLSWLRNKGRTHTSLEVHISSMRSRSLEEIPVWTEIAKWDAQNPLSALYVGQSRHQLAVGTRFGVMYELNISPQIIKTTPTRLHSPLEATIQAQYLWGSTQSSEIVAISPFGRGYLVVDETSVYLVTKESLIVISSVRGATCVSSSEAYTVFGMDQNCIVRIVDNAIQPFGCRHRDRQIAIEDEFFDVGTDERVCEVYIQGEQIIACSGRTALIFWVSENGPEIRLGMASRITCVALSSDSIAVTAAFDGVAQSWDSHTGQLLTTFKNHNSSIYSLDVSMGNKVATGSGGYTDLDEDFSVWVWDAFTGEGIAHISLHSGLVAGVRFSQPRGRFLTTAGWDGQLKHFDLCNRERVQLLSFVSSAPFPREVLEVVLNFLI